MTTKSFRILVSANFIVVVAAIASDYYIFGIEDSGRPPDVPFPALAGFLGILYFLGLLVTLPGLLRFRRWARSLGVATALVGILTTTALGRYETSGFVDVWWELTALLSGLWIAAAYWSPISSEFDRK